MSLLLLGLSLGRGSLLQLPVAIPLPQQLRASPLQFSADKVLHGDQRRLPCDDALDGTIFPQIDILDVCHSAILFTFAARKVTKENLLLWVWIR